MSLSVDCESVTWSVVCGHRNGVPGEQHAHFPTALLGVFSTELSKWRLFTHSRAHSDFLPTFYTLHMRAMRRSVLMVDSMLPEVVIVLRLEVVVGSAHVVVGSARFAERMEHTWFA